MKPTGVTANRQNRQVTIHWDDGHESAYSFTFMRNACPCAECRGGHEGMGTLPDPSTYDLPDQDTPATRLRNLEAVGRSEEHTSELQSPTNLVCRLLLEK